MSSIITVASRKLTSSILEAQIRETPYVSETNREPNQRKDEIELSNPSFSLCFGGSHQLTSFKAADTSPLRT